MNLIISDEEKKEIKKVNKKFKEQKRKTKENIFYDLCFCLCAPQITFQVNKKIISQLIELDFYNKDIPLNQFYKILKPSRFYKNKSKYLLDMKKNFDKIYDMVMAQFIIRRNQKEIRDLLYNNVKGLGMKASSHFCRNLGFDGVAIIDTHILKFMNLTGNDISSYKKYKEVEKEFEEIAKGYGLTAAELDILIWKKYSKTEWQDFNY